METGKTNPLDDFAKVYELFFRPGEVTEIRALGLSGENPRAWKGYARDVVSGYFDNPDDFAKAALALNQAWANGIYFTLNPVNRALLSRASNRLKAAVETTTNSDIVCLRNLLLDIDPERTKGVSATAEEIERAAQAMAAVKEILKKQGWPDGLEAFSGNGRHLVHRLPDLPNDKEHRDLIKGALKAANRMFPMIDPVTFNPSRICKCYGTMARKGDDTADRPYRRSYIEPSCLNGWHPQPVTKEQLKWLAGQAPKADPKQGQTDSGGTRFNVAQWLESNDRAFREKALADGATMYCLETCPFEAEHTGATTKGDSGIIQQANGLLLFQCFHAHCADKTWADARRAISGEDKLSAFMEGTGKTAEPKQESSKKTMSLRVVDAAEMLKIEFKPREALLSPWLHTQGLTMIHAYRGVGKTYVGLGIAVAIASAGSYLRWTAPRPRGVLVIDGEMPGIAMQERLAHTIKSSKTELAAPVKIITPDLQETGMPNLSTQEGQEAIEPWLEGIALIIVDNISTLCRTGRENEGESWTPLQEWALRLRSRGYAINFFHHDGKGDQQRGTSRKEDVLDCVLHLKHPGDYSPAEGARFEVHFEKARMIYGDDVKPFEAKLVSNPAGLQEWITKDLEDSLMESIVDLIEEGVPQKEIAEMLKCSPGTVSKYKNRAQARGLLKGGK